MEKWYIHINRGIIGISKFLTSTIIFVGMSIWVSVLNKKSISINYVAVQSDELVRERFASKCYLKF